MWFCLDQLWVISVFISEIIYLPNNKYYYIVNNTREEVNLEQH